MSVIEFPPLQLDQLVKHKCGANQVGMVTAVIRRRGCCQYGVTWSGDLVERWHTAAELTPWAAELEPRIGILPTP